MISKLIDKHSIINLWRASKEDESILAGFKSAYLGESVEGKWLAVIDDEVIEVNTRITAMKQLRKNGYWTRISKVSIC